MRLPHPAHTDRPWRIHALTRDFRLQDVWSYRMPGAGAGDFPAALAALRAADRPELESPAVRFLFAVRWKLGALLGWDEPQASASARVPTLRDRLPEDLRGLAPGPGPGNEPLTPVYELDDECAGELVNRTVHTVMHLGWVRADAGEYELRMAVLVKPNGLLGKLYMAAIAPFRYLIIYPALTRQWELAWRERARPEPIEGDRAGGDRTAGAASGGDRAGGAASRGDRAADEPGTVHGYLGEHELPASFRDPGPLTGFDYVDLFTRTTSEAATSEEWARAMFGDVPSAMERFIWRGLLGLRLSRGRSPHTVAGWRIAERGPDWIRLSAASWFLTSDLLIRAGDGQVSLLTSLRYDRLLGRVVWPPLSAVHRRLGPGLLHEAAAKIRAERGARTAP
ncbi:uncharacterized protein DUF2867 [Nocardiopsis sp. Huas11]|uniref:DUF2867 domain-containing protein n=1 Tax=Nocardiopsis sp. Huas11 TaxID=2183912 RepID=UPI000EB3D729|nr:DUF2867 domain-containing protein [Nocardiopsis sp. Huas11]RKS05921.1 uncharacterized protein DUF2867 [Nocardiopsis sp. Huas11]